MSVSPADFLESAISLGQEKTEMALRNALSRAYYAAFHRAQLSLSPEKLSEDEERAGVHRRYIAGLLQSSDKPQRLAGIKLQTMHSRRVVADYRLEDDIARASLALQIDNARTVFTTCDSADAAARF